MPAHFPVLLSESLQYLAIRPEGVYLDASAGLGGHTAAIASRLSGQGKLIANDRDAQSLEMARQNCALWADRIEFRQGAFSELAQVISPQSLDGLIADLG